jgi:hypothetical protein
MKGDDHAYDFLACRSSRGHRNVEIRRSWLESRIQLKNFLLLRKECLSFQLPRPYEAHSKTIECTLPLMRWMDQSHTHSSTWSLRLYWKKAECSWASCLANELNFD